MNVAPRPWVGRSRVCFAFSQRLIFNFLKQKQLIFNFFVNRNWKKLTDSRKKAKILADNRKSHHPIETLRSVEEIKCHCFPDRSDIL